MLRPFPLAISGGARGRRPGGRSVASPFVAAIDRLSCGEARDRPDTNAVLSRNSADTLARTAGGSDGSDLGCIIRDGRSKDGDATAIAINGGISNRVTDNVVEGRMLIDPRSAKVD